MNLLALLGLLTDQNDSFSYPIIYFNQRNPQPFTYLKPQKGTPFGGASPVGNYRDYPPGGLNQYKSFRNVRETYRLLPSETVAVQRQSYSNLISKLTHLALCCNNSKLFIDHLYS